MRHLFASLFILITAACGNEPEECAADEHCLTVAPVDGVSDLPDGRIAVAWIVFDDGGDRAEVAFDAPWSADALTRIPLGDIAEPSAAFTNGAIECGPNAVAVIIVSTDPDGSGSITRDEILNPTDDGIYGIARAVVIRASVACDDDLEAFPDGILAGTHVYSGSEGTAFLLADGVPVALETCAPDTDGCKALEGPF